MQPTAILIIIGDEILSGKVIDLNLNFIAKSLFDLGIILKEMRVIGDNKEAIIKTITELNNTSDYIFTTGGIGPTHDDITTESIAEALGLSTEENLEAVSLITEYYNKRNRPLHPRSLRMARIPKGATLIGNPVSSAPGFIINNIYVMAGVPEIMQAMFGTIKNILSKGKEIHNYNIDISAGESKIADYIEFIQDLHPQVTIGSYPYKKGENHFTTISLTSISSQQIKEVASKLLLEFGKMKIDVEKRDFLL